MKLQIIKTVSPPLLLFTYIFKEAVFMKLLLDTADILAIKKTMEYFPVDGFTTNPQIMSKISGDAYETMKEFKKLVSPERMLHMQVTVSNAEDMVKQAKKLAKFFGDNFYTKIPATDEGIKAVRMLKAEGLHSTVTAVFSPMQALIAARAGADFVAPYVNRIDNICGDGVEAVCTIIDMFNNYDYETKVLAASFKNVQQVYELAVAGCYSATITPDMMKMLIAHPYTEKSLVDFDTVWKKRFDDLEITDFVCDEK